MCLLLVGRRGIRGLLLTLLGPVQARREPHCECRRRAIRCGGRMCMALHRILQHGGRRPAFCNRSDEGVALELCLL
jgi:hypothetical protein